MQAIIKINGVQPSALPVLHGVVKQPYMHTPDQEIMPNGTAIHDEPNKVPYARITCSEFEPESGTYTVTLILNLVIPSSNTDVPDIFAPLSALVGLIKSVDPRLLPDAVAMPTSKLDESLVETLVSQTLGEKSDCDITNSRTGEIIAPANRKLTRTVIKALVRNLGDLNLRESGDLVNQCLRGAQMRMQNESQPTPQ
jgi:hypothetical protein